MLVDGGLVANLPISYTRDLGADIVIAVDVGADGAKFMDRPRTALGVLTQVFVAVERVVSQQQAPTADFIIIPRVGHIRCAPICDKSPYGCFVGEAPTGTPKEDAQLIGS